MDPLVAFVVLVLAGLALVTVLKCPAKLLPALVSAWASVVLALWGKK